LADRTQRPSRGEANGDVLVIGLGRFGSSLARTLADMGHRVLAIDMSAELVQRYAGELTHVVQGDATNEAVLRQLGAHDMGIAAVCIGTDIESSVLCTAALADIGVRNIWAKAITTPHGKILDRVGAHHVVFPEAEMGQRVAHLLAGRILEYVALDTDFVLVEMPVPPSFVGINLGDSGLRAKHHITVVCVKPEGQPFTYATSETLLGPDDLIVIAGHRSHVDDFVRNT
jgi:trk system potassium uptake protein TrkA